jgi:hypothetical protein
MKYMIGPIEYVMNGYIYTNVLSLLSMRPPHPANGRRWSALSPKIGGEGRVRGSLALLKE